MKTSAPYPEAAPMYFDFAAALDRCCGDQDFLAEMGELLVYTAATQLTAIDDAIAARSAPELRAAAHALKGAVSSMTSAQPYELLRELEQRAVAGGCDGEEANIIALRISIDHLLAEIQQWSNHRTALPATADSF